MELSNEELNNELIKEAQKQKINFKKITLLLERGANVNCIVEPPESLLDWCILEEEWNNKCSFSYPPPKIAKLIEILKKHGAKTYRELKKGVIASIDETDVQMKFEYDLCSSSGWAAVKIEYGSFSKIYRVSYCEGDNITSLLQGLIALLYRKESAGINYHVEDYSYAYHKNFTWHIDEEGSEVDFVFFLCEDPKKIFLEIIESTGYGRLNKESVFFEELNLDEVIDNVLASCDKMLAKYGILGYNNNFWHEFPVSPFLALKDYRKKKLTYNYNEETCLHDEVFRVQKTSLNCEVDYLLNK